MKCFKFKSLPFYSRHYIPVIFFIIALSGLCCSSIPEFEVINPGVLTLSLDNGKRQMQELSRMSNVPSDDGSCWKSALENLQTGCQKLTEESQARMAFRFASCFNEMIGLSPYICESVTPIKDCLKQLDNSARGTFREYFLHTQDMCYYLRQEIWQEQTNSAVTRLTDAAVDATMQMVEQRYIQEQIYSSQQESLKVQSNMKKDNEDLYHTVVKVRDVFDDFSATAREHQLISSEIFDKLSRMQKLVAWIQGEMSLLDMIFFYFGAIVFGYFATATTRTRAARFWLIVLFMIAIWSEKAIYKYLTHSDAGPQISPEDVQSYIWVIRKIAAGAGTLIVLIAGALYRDLQIVHNNMLVNMNFALERVVQFVNDQAKGHGINANTDLYLMMKKNEGDLDLDSDDSDDTFSDYSSDDLEHELSDLHDDAENIENVEPGRLPAGRLHAVRPPMPRRYNLRERSASATPRENAVVHEEPATDSAKTVKKNKLPVPKPMQSPSHLNYFSSDDDEQ